MIPGANGSLGTSDFSSEEPASAAGSAHMTSTPGPVGSPSAPPTGSVSVRPKRELSGGVLLNVEYETTQPVCAGRVHIGMYAKSPPTRRPLATVAFAPGMIAETRRRLSE